MAVSPDSESRGIRGPSLCSPSKTGTVCLRHVDKIGGGTLKYCGVENDYVLGFSYLRDVYCKCFTGLCRLENIYRNSGVSTENER